MACRSTRRAWLHAAGRLIGDVRSWVLALVGIGLFVAGILVSGDKLGVTLVVLGVSIMTLGVLLPLVSEAEIGPGGLKLKKALRDWDGEFEPFVRAESESLQRFAALLSGAPPAQATEFVEEALARGYVYRTGITSGRFSLYVLCTLVHVILGAERLRLVDGSLPRPAQAAAQGGRSESVAMEPRPLLAIPFDLRAIVLLRHYRGLAVGEIAQLLDRPVREVETGLRRAESMLEEQGPTR
jgi:DNA-directed RNA polymerase specialized sigma24 family protein